MVKLVKKEIITEAKQLGKLYHVTTLESVANYIAPTDTLKGSGKYKNWLKGGRTDVVSFTRDKRFVVGTRSTRQANVLFDFEVDGDKLSEKYKVFPYNDLVFDQDSGASELKYHSNKSLEHEEVVIGEIHPFSKYVKGVRFCVSVWQLNDFINIEEHIRKANDYLFKFDIQYDEKLKEKFGGSNILHFSSYNDFVKKTDYIVWLLNNPKIKKEKSICDALSCFDKDQLQTLLRNELNSTRKDDRVVYLLETALSDKREVLKMHLTWDDVKSHIAKKDLKEMYSSTRIDPSSAYSYLRSYSTEELWDLLFKYGSFDTEQAYTISNKAKAWFKDHPEDIHTSTYGDISERDFDRKINVYKMLDYLHTNYDRRKVNRLLFDFICMNDKDIPNHEFEDLKDEDVYTLGINKLKGSDLVDYLITWGELLSEEQLNKILENMHE